PEPEKKQSDRDLFFAGTGVNVRKADNLRLQYIKLCYRSEFVKPRKSSGIQEWECFAAVLNPGILWKANHLAQDPDYNQNEFFYPVPRSYTVGVSVRYKIKSRIHPAEPTGL